MSTLDRIASAEAAGTGFIAAGNAAYFVHLVRYARRPARRAAAFSMMLLNLALVAEAALYLAVLPDTGAALEGTATTGVRTVALAAVALVALLILRGRGGGR